MSEAVGIQMKSMQSGSETYEFRGERCDFVRSGPDQTSVAMNLTTIRYGQVRLGAKVGWLRRGNVAAVMFEAVQLQSDVLMLGQCSTSSYQGPGQQVESRG